MRRGGRCEAQAVACATKPAATSSVSMTAPQPPACAAAVARSDRGVRPPTRRRRRRPVDGLWWAAVGVATLPGLWLLALTLGAFGGLGTNPVERLLHESGQIAMIALLVALAVTPIRRLTGWNRVARLRRMLGLMAFFYATVHLLIWLGVDLWWDVALIVADLFERPYITLGAVAWLILLLLAATSFDAAVRLLGRGWVLLHRLVYGAAVLALLHLVWLTRADYTDAWRFGGVLALLLGVRLWHAIRRRRPSVSAAS